jgi:hypothetical protein
MGSTVYMLLNTNVNQPIIVFHLLKLNGVHVLKFSYILSCKENFLLKVGNISEIFQTNFIGNSGFVVLKILLV